MRTSSMFRLTIATGIVLASSFCVETIHAQDSAPTATPAETKPAVKLPTPREIIDRYIEATGGVDAYKKHKSRMSEGFFAMPAMGIKGQMLMYQSVPDLMYVSIDLPGIGSMKQGFNGTVGWSMDPMRGPTLLKGAQLEQLKREADFFGSMDMLKFFESSKTSGTTTFGDEECYVVELTGPEGVTTAYYSVKSGLALGMKNVAMTEVGEIPTITTMTEYKDFGGVKIPTVTNIEAMGQQQQLVIEKIVYDEVKPEIFELPLEIKALAKAQEATGDKKDEKGSSTDAPKKDAGTPGS